MSCFAAGLLAVRLRHVGCLGISLTALHEIQGMVCGSQLCSGQNRKKEEPRTNCPLFVEMIL